MNDAVIYLLKANVILSLLYGFYVLLLRRDTFYVWHRAYLLCTLAATLLLPPVNVASWLSPAHEASVAMYIPALED